MPRLVAAVAVAAITLSTGLSFAASPTPAEASPFLQQVRSHFAAWDADHDGALSEAEVERALADPANAGPAGAAAATLRRAFYAYDKFRPLTLQAIADAVNHDTPTVPDGKPKPPPYAAMYAADLKKITATNRAVFAGPVPHVQTLGQGRLGDCFLLASVGTMAACQPERLGRIVEPLPDGRLAVHLGGGRTVTIAPPTDGEVAVGANAHVAADDGVWGNVFEVAIGQVFLERQKGNRYVTPYQIIGVGGSPAASLAILTGHTCRRVGCEDFQKAGKLSGPDRDRRLNAVRQALVDAFATKHLVVGGTADITAGEAVVPGLYYDHSYGVLGYDRTADTVTFWNPMGNGFKPKGEPGLEQGFVTWHGRFDVPLAEAVMWFGSFSIETDEPAAN